MNHKQLPTICPSCQGELNVQRLACGTCGTTVGGSFELPILVRLSKEDQAFIIRLIEASGSLKEMARVYRLSYPTIRNRLDSLIDRIAEIKKNTDTEEDGDA